MEQVDSKILLDIGSSTVKVYRFSSNKVSNFLTRSISFKEKFNSERGISESSKKELFEIIDVLKEKNQSIQVKTYATGIFRKLAPPARVFFLDEFFQRTGLFLNIINQGLESFYLAVALMGKCSLNEPTLLINIGGHSIEIVVMYGKEAIEKKNIDFGVGAINTRFPGVNAQISKINIEEIDSFVRSRLPILLNKVKIAFYTGGELDFMQLADYPLSRNDLFSDDEHPSVITAKDFFKKNEELFKKIKLADLELLMPENPSWMRGARSCSAIAQSICKKYKLETIIPSNSNIVNGAVRQEFRYVSISGSFRKHLDYILEIKKHLETTGVEILSPRFIEPKNPGEEFVVFSGEEGKTPLELKRHHLSSIAKSDALVVCDPEGYVGASALIEIGYANAMGKRIIFTEAPEEFMLNILPAEIGL